jgi:uncharacterized protein
MVQNFSAYPRKWNWLLAHPDPSIDHRRVPNLAEFFTRRGETLPITANFADYLPGDIVTWGLGGGVPQIGIIVDRKSTYSGRYMIVHNIEAGPQLKDVLFNCKITGRYPYFGASL